MAVLGEILDNAPMEADCALSGRIGLARLPVRVCRMWTLHDAVEGVAHRGGTGQSPLISGPIALVMLCEIISRRSSCAGSDPA
jgi:hypothetical protein